MKYLSLTLLVLALACNGEEGGNDKDAGRDTSSSDTRSGDSGSNDSGSNDSGSNDTGSTDTGSGDGGQNDSGSIDSGLDGGAIDSGPFECGPLGKEACGEGVGACPDGFICAAGQIETGLCIPPDPSCDKNTKCAGGEICMIEDGLDKGVCFSPEEARCLCEGQNADTIFPQCAK